MGVMGGAFAAYLFVLVPFSVAMGLYLGLNGARFGALCRTMLVALAVAILLALIVLTLASGARLPPHAPRAIVLAAAAPQGFLWGPELVLAFAFAVHGYLHRDETTRPLPTWIAGPAMGVSVETLMGWRAASLSLASQRGDSVTELLALALAGFCAAAVLTAPGWFIGRMIHDGATPDRHIPPRTMPRAWTVWPAWIVLAVTARVLRSHGIIAWP
ncbi:hypothetical protein ROS9278_04484 [Roseomonas sp. CECT 9278]|nr:hypothetical protein ROS9278_04484 [Roseomonas sp. CECT 9278]